MLLLTLTGKILYNIFYSKNCAKYGMDADPEPEPKFPKVGTGIIVSVLQHGYYGYLVFFLR
jgi:hypothetical protein